MAAKRSFFSQLKLMMQIYKMKNLICNVRLIHNEYPSNADNITKETHGVLNTRVLHTYIKKFRRDE